MNNLTVQISPGADMALVLMIAMFLHERPQLEPAIAPIPLIMVI